MADCVCVCFPVRVCVYVYMCNSLSPFVCPYAIAKGRRGQGEGHKKRKWAEAEEESEQAGARRALSSAASNIVGRLSSFVFICLLYFSFALPLSLSRAS